MVEEEWKLKLSPILFCIVLAGVGALAEELWTLLETKVCRWLPEQRARPRLDLWHSRDAECGWEGVASAAVATLLSRFV